MKPTPRQTGGASPQKIAAACDTATEIVDAARALLSIIEITSSHVLDALDSRAEDLLDGDLKKRFAGNFFYLTPEAQRRLIFLAGEAEERAISLSDRIGHRADELFDLHVSASCRPESAGGA
ncbi:UNVERIFIED_ORG: uncharacterized protein (DUF1778 family) [Rhizobium nepotum]|nr:uncharacterized protein (DUF1778 family) [Rhizobium nepotum]